MFGKSSFSSAPISGLPQKTFLSSLSVLSTTVVSIVKALSKFISISSTGAVNLFKAISKAINILSSSLATLINVPGKLLFVASTATISYIKDINKIFATILGQVTVSLTNIASHFVLLSSIAIGMPIITKNISKIYFVIVSNAVTYIRVLGKTLSFSITATVSYIRARLVSLIVVIQGVSNNVSGAINGFILNSEVINGFVQGQQYFVSLATSITRVLTLQVSSVANLVIGKAIAKIMAIISTVTLTIKRSISIALSVISATIASILAIVFPVLGAVVRYTFIVDARDRLTKLYKDRLEIIDFRNRLQKLYKIRTEIANKRQDKAQK